MKRELHIGLTIGMGLLFLAMLALRLSGCSTAPTLSGGAQTVPSPIVSGCCPLAWGMRDGNSYSSRGTGYTPENTPMEGGNKDRYGQPLRTLQSFLAGKAEYVSVAMDMNLGTVKRKLCSPELNATFGKPLKLLVVDTGGAFTGAGWKHIDIATDSQKFANSSQINRPFTVLECQ